MIEVAFVAAGTIAGVFTGLVPGIHLNTVSVLVPLAASRGDFNLALFVIAMSVSHSFSDFIPSILLGAPSEENYLSVLPGHAMLLRGEGLQAIGLALSGCMAGALLSVAFAFPFILFAEKFFPVVRAMTPWLLGLSLALMVLHEKGTRKKALAIAVITLSAALGVVALRFLAFPNQLFALVMGLFGASTLIQSMREGSVVPEQSEGAEGIGAGRMARGTGLGFIAGSIVSIVPSMGSNQAAFMVEKVFGRIGRKEYVAMLGSASVCGAALSYFFLYVTGLGRTGSAVAVKSLTALSAQHLPFVAMAILASAGASFLLCRWISGKAVRGLQRIDYGGASACILVFLAFLALLLCGAIGLAVMATGAMIGMVPQLLGLRRTHCMAFLAIPTALIYLGV